MELAAPRVREPESIAVSRSLSPERMVEIYRLMYLSRRVDDREILLKRQQKIFFQISAAGHEALQVTAGLALRPGYDWFFPYYRDRALCLALGVTPADMLLQAVGAATDPASGGRQMPTHWSSRELHIVSTSSSTTTQLLHAVGCAEAGRYFSHHPEAANKDESDYRAFHDVEFHGDEVVFTSLGDGSTSQGEFWEALNTASNQKLPVIFCVEDNGYAISVPVEVNTPGGNISSLVANFPNFYFAEVDGTDPESCLRAFESAAAHCRAGLGPAFVHGHVVRPYSHAFSDDDKHYRSAAEREADALRDPLAKMQMRLLREGILTDSEITALEQSLDLVATEAGERALEAPLPKVADITRHVYSEDLDPTRANFATEQIQEQTAGSPRRGPAGSAGAPSSAPSTAAASTPSLHGPTIHPTPRRGFQTRMSSAPKPIRSRCSVRDAGRGRTKPARPGPAHGRGPTSAQPGRWTRCRPHRRGGPRRPSGKRPSSCRSRGSDRRRRSPARVRPRPPPPGQCPPCPPWNSLRSSQGAGPAGGRPSGRRPTPP